MEEPRTIFDKVDDGNSPIYVGISYLKIVAQQINEIRLAQKEALRNHELLWGWLHELRTFYDLIESRTDLAKSDTEIDLFEYRLSNNELIRADKKVKEKEKYDSWFEQIELMLERNSQVISSGIGNPFQEKRYINDKKIVSELSKCYRAVMIDANKRHLIMPEGQKDMKELAKQEWIDRDFKKEF